MIHTVLFLSCKLFKVLCRCMLTAQGVQVFDMADMQLSSLLLD